MHLKTTVEFPHVNWRWYLRDRDRMNDSNPYRPTAEPAGENRKPNNPAVAKWFMVGVVLIVVAAYAGNELPNPIADYVHMILLALGGSAIIFALFERYWFTQTAETDLDHVD